MRGILFDFDGVLADTGGAICQAASRFLSAYGLEITAEWYDRQFHGMGGSHWRSAIANLLQLKGLGPENGLIDLLQDTISEAAIANAAAIPGMAELWNDIDAPRGVVSSSPRSELIRKFERLGLANCAVLIGAEDVPQTKPFPDPYLRAASALGLFASDCLVVEDSITGIRSGNAAGAQTILFGQAHKPMSLTNEIACACAPNLVARTVSELRSHLAAFGVLRSH